MRINIIIILYIIFVIRRRDKKRIKINNFYSQILQIVQLIPDSLQITSIKITYIHSFRIMIPVIDLSYWLVNIGIFPFQHIIGRITVTESVCKDLIHNGTFRPVRRCKSRSNPKVIHLNPLISYAKTIKIYHFISGSHPKRILHHIRSELPADPVIVEYRPRICLLHFIIVAVRIQFHTVHIRCRSTKEQIYRLFLIRLRGNNVASCSVTK